MPRLAGRSIPSTAADDKRLSGVLPEMAQKYTALRSAAAARGVVVRLAAWDGAGTRTEADTTKHLRIRDQEYAIYAAAVKKAGRTPVAKEKWRPIAPFGKSKHNYGGAVDTEVLEWPEGKSQQWGMDLLDQLAPGLGLVVGDSFGDEPHFELSYSLATLKAKWDALHRGSLQPRQHADPNPLTPADARRDPEPDANRHAVPLTATPGGGGCVGGAGAPRSRRPSGNG